MKKFIIAAMIISLTACAPDVWTGGNPQSFEISTLVIQLLLFIIVCEPDELNRKKK